MEKATSTQEEPVKDKTTRQDQVAQQQAETTETHGLEEKKTDTKEKKKGFFDKSKKDHQKKIDELQSQILEQQDKYLRLFSEFDNYRKRTLKEKAELISTASEGIILSLLPIVDDFERAIKAAENSEGASALPEGMLLIYNKLIKTMQQKGVEPILAIGEVFNTDFHEAITNIPVSDEAQKSKVLDEIEKGYTLHSKVIRFSKVVVAI